MGEKPYTLNPLPDDKILDWSKLKQFADDNFKFDENSRNFSKTLWVKEKLHVTSNFSFYCLLRAISPFPTVFSKGLFARGVKRYHCVGMG